jgi:hypothetical protein
MRKKFRATIEKAGGVGSWSRIVLPFSVEESWGVKGRLQVKGSLGEFPKLCNAAR